MKQWSFDVRNGGPSQAATLERKNEQALNEHYRDGSLDGSRSVR